MGWREHGQREGLDASIVVDVIEGVEFRSQSSAVLRRRPHVPSPPPVRVPTGGKRPMPPSAMQMDANDRWLQRQSWPPPQPMSPAAVQRFRPPPSRPEPHGSLPALQAASEQARRREADQADQFLLKVKQALGNGDKHRLFLEVMMGYESSVLDTVEVMEHVSALLHGHWSLLRQFNDFLPDGHRIEQLPPHSSSVTRAPGQRPSSTPAPPQGAPDGCGRRGAPRGEAGPPGGRTFASGA